MGIDLVSGIVIEIFPDYLDKLTATVGVSGKWWVSILLVITALFSIPTSNYLRDKDLAQQLIIFLTLSAIVLTGIFVIDNHYITIILLIFFTIFDAVINVCSLPLALRNTSIRNKAFGVGIFFCAFEIPNSIIDIALIQW